METLQIGESKMDNNENVKTEKLKPGDIKTTQCPRCGIDITTTVDKYGLYSFPELCPQCGINMEFYKKNNNIEWLKKQREECVKKLKDIKEEQDQIKQDQKAFSFWKAFIKNINQDGSIVLAIVGVLGLFTSIVGSYDYAKGNTEEPAVLLAWCMTLVFFAIPFYRGISNISQPIDRLDYVIKSKEKYTTQIRQLDKEIEHRKRMEETGSHNK